MAPRTTTDRAVRALGQVVLGAVLVVAGIGHLTNLREEFRAQVPSWVPLDPDAVVLASGVVELGLGSALLATWKPRPRAVLGVVTAAFFLAVFPGNIAQLTGHRDAFGLDSDVKRAVRLVFQPLLVLWALAATDARLLRRRLDPGVGRT